MREKIEKLIDDINWEIADMLDYGFEPDGVIASLIIPAIVAFATTLFFIVLTRGVN